LYKAAVARKGEPLPHAQVTGADALPIEEQIKIIPHK